MLSLLKNYILGAILNSMPTLGLVIINEGFLYPVLLNLIMEEVLCLKLSKDIF